MRDLTMRASVAKGSTPLTKPRKRSADPTLRG